MKKLCAVVVSLIAVLGLAFAGTAYWLGMKTEKQFRAAIDAFPPSPLIKLTMPLYQRGLFSAQAVTALEISGPPHQAAGGAPQSLRFTITHDIRHGPLPLGRPEASSAGWQPLLALIRSRLTLVPVGLEKTPPWADLQDQLVVTADTAIDLAGAGTTDARMPAFEKTVEQEGRERRKITVRWQGFTSRSAVSPDLKSIKASLAVPGLTLQGERGQLVLGAIRAEIQAAPGKTGITLGEVKSSLERLEVSEQAAGQALLLEQLTFASVTSEQGETIHVRQTAGFHRLAIGPDSYGPFGLNLELRNLDAAAFLELQKAIQAVQQQALAGKNGPPPAAMQDLARLAPQFLKRSPEIELKELSLQTRDGEARGRLLIALRNVDPASGNNPLALLAALHVEADGRVAEHLLAKTMKRLAKEGLARSHRDQQGGISDRELDRRATAESRGQLEALTRRNYLRREQDHFLVSIRYGSGSLTVNGRLIPLEELLQLGR